MSRDRMSVWAVRRHIPPMILYSPSPLSMSSRRLSSTLRFHMSPLVVAAITRHLLAVLYRVCDGPSSVEQWRSLATAGQFDESRVHAYLDGVADRMDLFHPTRPFAQTRGLIEQFAEYVTPIDELEVVRARWGGGRELFRHRPASPPPRMAPARAARALLAHQAFATGGLVKKPGKYGIEDLIKLSAQEERIYRLRCVEGWSMVIPWVGYSLAELIKRVEPQGSAKYVEFVTLADKATMPFVGSRVLDWPYVEGLRLDEAMHPLTLLAFGMYGEVLPNQNGAPVRLVVPWKYGFKSAKSIVKIRFVEKEPGTAWNKAAKQEYGFYSNVNPDVDHPRWSQATERRIGEDGLFAKKRKTLMFNGYEAQVGQLYAGMDLKKFY